MTNEFTAAIEQLDQKRHRPVTLEDWKRIGDKPAATLTDDDITVCGFFGGPSAAAAARARRDAAPLQTKSAEPAPTKIGDLLIDDVAAEIVKLIAEALAPVRERVTTAERTATELSARVLELEAQRAATSKVDA